MLGCEVGLVLCPDVARALELRPRLHLAASDLVDGVADELHDVEAVECDLGLGEIVGDAGDEGRAHVDRGLLDAGGIAAVRLDMIRKLTDDIGAATVGDEHDASVVDVGDDGDVVLSALCRGLIDGDACDAGEIHARDGRADVVEDDAPQTFVGDLEEARGDGDGHMDGERHGEALEQQREAGAGPCPRHGDEAHAALRAVDAWRARGEDRLVLEEVEMAPLLLDGVVHGATARVALRAAEAAACLEVERDIEAPLGGVERGRCDEPRRRDAEGELKEVIVAHVAPGLGSILAASVPPDRPALKDKPPRGAQVRVLDRRPPRRRIALPSGSSSPPTTQQP